MMESLKNKLTEEEARELLGHINIYRVNKGFDVIYEWKKKGYIKQNPVEKAEEIFNRINIEFETECVYRLRQHQIDEIIKSHEYLKKQLEEK